MIVFFTYSTFKKIGSLNAHVSRVHTKGILEEEKEIISNQGRYVKF